MTSKIDSETPPVESKKLSYSMSSSSLSHLLKWVKQIKEDPASEARLISLRPYFSSNAQKIIFGSAASPDQEKEGISREQLKNIPLTLELSPTRSDFHSILPLLSTKIAEKREIFAEIESLEFGVHLKTADDRVSLLCQLIRDLATFKSEKLEFKPDIQSLNFHQSKENSPLLQQFELITALILQSSQSSLEQRYTKTISITTAAVLSSFLFSEILGECKIESKFQPGESLDAIDGLVRNFTGKEVPMIVFSTADFNSALDASVNAAWFSEGLVSWATTAVLVQESIFPNFVAQFKSRLQKSAENISAVHSKPNVEEDVEVYVQKVISEAKGRNLEVFQVFPSKGRDTPATLIIGDFVNSHITPTSSIRDPSLPILFVVPFRTLSEGISMANESLSKVTASVWSESLSLCLSSTSRLNFGTIWVNSFGIFDARVPVFSFSNGCEPVCATGIDYIHWAAELRGWQSLTGPLSAIQDPNLDIDTLLNSAFKAHLTWMSNDIQDKMEVIDKIWNSTIEPSVLTPNLRHKLNDAIRGNFTCSFSMKVKNCLVSSSVTPIGVIVFIADSDNFPNANYIFLKSVLTAIFNGNAVVAVTQDFYKLLSALKFCLPEHLLGVLPQKTQTDEILNHLKKHKVAAENVGVWTLRPPLYQYEALVEQNFVKSYQLPHSADIGYHTTKRKVVWLPVA